MARPKKKPNVVEGVIDYETPNRKTSRTSSSQNGFVTIEGNYYAPLNKMVEKAQKLFSNDVLPLLTDANRYLNDSPVDDFEKALVVWGKNVDKIFSDKRVDNIAGTIAKQTSGRTKKEVKKQLKSVDALPAIKYADFDDNYKASIDVWKKANVGLITDISVKMKSDINTVVSSGFSAGLRSEEIAKNLMSQTKLKPGVFKKTKTRAKLIARDQVQKLNSSLTKKSYKDLGLELYVWQAVGDSRTRDQHQRNDGKVFTFSGTVKVDGQTYHEAPNGEQPGQEINCRCSYRMYVP